MAPQEQLATAVPAVICRDVLAVFSAGTDTPLLLMPRPHAAAVAGDPTSTALVDHLVALGRRVRRLALVCTASGRPAYLQAPGAI